MVSLFSAPGFPASSRPVERMEGVWRVYPLEGAMELFYRDAGGHPSIRRIMARELKVGPGKTLLGGIDMTDDGYRGFRADRIGAIVDGETGQRIDRNILDWLMKRATDQKKERKGASRRRASPDTRKQETKRSDLSAQG